MRPVRVARSLRAVIVTAVVTALVVFPLGALAGHSFTDVPTTHQFHADIAALKDSGVSPTGCGGGNYCPDDLVTRGQMAAFLNRIGALGPGKVPVANATKLDGLDSTAFERDGTTRLSSDVDVTSSGTAETDWVELTFTRPAGRTMLGFVVEATGTVPPTCPVSASGTVLVRLDSDPAVRGASIGWTAPTANTDVTFRLSTVGQTWVLLAQATDATHTLKVRVQDGCNDGSDWTFKSIVVDVVFAG